MEIAVVADRDIDHAMIMRLRMKQRNQSNVARLLGSAGCQPVLFGSLPKSVRLIGQKVSQASAACAPQPFRSAAQNNILRLHRAAKVGRLTLIARGRFSEPPLPRDNRLLLNSVGVLLEFAAKDIR